MKTKSGWWGTALLLSLLALTAVPAEAEFFFPIGGTITRGPGSQGHTYNAGDIAGPNGYPVGTSNDGWYHAKLNDPDGYGYYAMVKHKNTCGGTAFYTLYAHLSKFTGYAIGTWMTRSAPDGSDADGLMSVGYEGNTGRSTGPHVHFEIRQGSTKLWYYAPKYSTADKNTYIGSTSYDCSPPDELQAPGGEIIVDSNNNGNDSSKGYIEVSANWTSSSYTSGYYGTGYYYASTQAISDPATFWFYLPEAGSRTIDGWWTSGSNRSTTAPYLFWDASGNKLGTVHVNQQTNGGQWNTLGTYSFPAGWNKVQLSRWTTEGYQVIADAVRIR